jgi:hypothetical protein
MQPPDTTGAPPLEVVDHAAVLELLGPAEAECRALGSQATHPLDNLAIWHYRATTIAIAADTRRTAVDPPLLPPGTLSVATGQDPLPLLNAAMDGLLALPDDLDTLALFHGRLDTSDALAAVRLPYA